MYFHCLTKSVLSAETEGEIRKNGKKKKRKIELIRFIFTMFIVFYHCQRHYLKGVLYAGHFTFFARG